MHAPEPPVPAAAPTDAPDLPDLPRLDGMRVGVVGPGRVGAALAGALVAAGIDVTCWCGRGDAGTDSAGRRRMADLAPDVTRLDLRQLAGSVDLVLIAVPDQALSSVVGQLAEQASQTGRDRWTGHAVWHVSGAAGLAPLAPLIARGAAGLALHPAMTFTGTRADLPRLAGAAWARTSTPAATDLADRLIHALGGRVVPIADEHRLVYHAALSHASNFFTVLEGQAADLLRGIGVADPVQLLQPLAAAALANAFAEPAVYTGPLSRGDQRSVAGHLQVLAEHDPQTVAAYACLSAATLRRGVAAGAIESTAAARVQAVLSGLSGLSGRDHLD